MSTFITMLSDEHRTLFLPFFDSHWLSLHSDANLCREGMIGSIVQLVIHLYSMSEEETFRCLLINLRSMKAHMPKVKMSVIGVAYIIPSIPPIFVQMKSKGTIRITCLKRDSMAATFASPTDGKNVFTQTNKPQKMLVEKNTRIYFTA